MQAKEQFLSNKQLTGWWSGISQDARFDSVLLHASAVALEAVPSEAERTGVLKLKEILLTLADADAAPVKFTSPGLLHDLEKPRRIAKPPEVKQPEKQKEK
jgi:hypothetical protein